MTTQGGSKTAVVAAIAGNLIIALIKFIAAAITGSSAMISEGIHSVVDTGNGGLVLGASGYSGDLREATPNPLRFQSLDCARHSRTSLERQR